MPTKLTNNNILNVDVSKVLNLNPTLDDDVLVNSISTLALRQSANEDKSKYDTGSLYVDVFQDSNGITGLTSGIERNSNEYISPILQGETFGTLQTWNPSQWVSTGLNTQIWTFTGSDGGFRVGQFNRRGYLDTPNGPSAGPNEDAMAQSYQSAHFPANTPFQFEFVGTNVTENAKPTHHGPYVSFQETADFPGGTNATLSNTSPFFFGGRWTNNSFHFDMQYGQGTNTSNHGGARCFEYDANTVKNELLTPSINSAPHNVIYKGQTTRITRDTVGIFRVYRNNVLQVTGNNNITGSIGVGIGGTGGHGQSATGLKYSIGTAGTFPSTGSFESNTITAPASVSEMGAVITYQDTSGTNALNSDIVLKLSADGGSNYATATLTPLPDFKTGFKMCKVNDVSVAAGTSLKYKIEFANQVNGSKEARIRGVSLQY